MVNFEGHVTEAISTAILYDVLICCPSTRIYDEQIAKNNSLYLNNFFVAYIMRHTLSYMAVIMAITLSKEFHMRMLN